MPTVPTLIDNKPPLRIVALISGGGSNLQAIMDSCKRGDIAATVVAVISNRPDAGGLQRAASAGIPTHSVDHTDFCDRQTFDAALRDTIDQHKPELVVLAGFMRILTAEFIQHYRGRMLNIHPSLLPQLRGLNTHQRALDSGFKQHGASVHFVTPELDGGALILQAIVDVLPNDTSTTLAARVLAQEHIIYPTVVNWFAQKRLHYDSNIAWLDGKPIHNPLNRNTYAK